MLFLLCCTVLSNSAFADGDPWAQKVNLDAILNVIKTTNVKQYMDPNKFIEYIEKHWEPTFQDLLDACKVSVSQDVEKNCKTFFREVVTEHNRLVDNANFAKEIAKPENWKEAQVYPAEMPNDGSTLIIKRDLDGGTPVSGNCENEIVVKSGTTVTLDCDAVKNGKHLTGYVDNYGYKKHKNWQFGFHGILSQAEYDSVSKSLKAVYEESGISEIVNDVEQNKSTETKERSYQCTGVSRTLSSAAEAQTPDELDCVSRLRARKVCQGNHNMLGINKVCDTNTRKCVYACMLNKMDFHNRKYKTICCNVSSSSDDVNCAWGSKEGNYTDVEGPGMGELSVQGC